MGTKRIGLAFSDSGGAVAFPHSVVPVSENSTQHILRLLSEERVDCVVIGDSLHRDNAKNPVAAHAQELADVLTAAGYSVVFAWEGYTSAHARRLHGFHEGAPRGVVARTRAKTQPAHVDATAAALILQSVLDARRS